MALDSTTTPEASRSGNLHKGTKTHKPGCACPFCFRKRNDSDGERILQNTLDESRKICQEREKQLATAQSDLRSATIALDWQKAEVARLAESLRLADQGRDEAVRGRSAGLEQIRLLQEQATANRRETTRLRERIDTLGNELDQAIDTLSNDLAQAGEHIRALEETVGILNADTSRLANQLADMERLRNAAEGRYMALLSRRTLEATIVIIATVAVLLVASAVVVFGGGR